MNPPASDNLTRIRRGQHALAETRPFAVLAALWKEYCRLHDLVVKMVARNELCRRLIANRCRPALLHRMEQMDRRLTRLEHDLGIAVEALAVFVRFWLTTSPPLPQPASRPPAPPSAATLSSPRWGDGWRRGRS